MVLEMNKWWRVLHDRLIAWETQVSMGARFKTHRLPQAYSWFEILDSHGTEAFQKRKEQAYPIMLWKCHKNNKLLQISLEIAIVSET